LAGKGIVENGKGKEIRKRTYCWLPGRYVFDSFWGPSWELQMGMRRSDEVGEGEWKFEKKKDQNGRGGISTFQYGEDPGNNNKAIDGKVAALRHRPKEEKG
jgi:hypothetical protein